MRIIVGFFIALFGLLGQPWEAKAEPLAEEMWVQNQGQQFIQALALYDDEERFMRLRTLINDSFDMQSMAKKVIGQRWANLDENMQSRFIDAFENYVIYVYAANPVNFGTLEFQVTDAVSLGNYTRESKVSANLTIPNSQNQTNVQENASLPLTAYFIVRPEDASFRIVDAGINGVSLVLFVKGMFSREMQNNQNNIYVTLHALEKAAYNAAQGNYQNLNVIPD